MLYYAKKGDEVKLIRFGQQGVKGAGKNPKNKSRKAREELVITLRHNAQNPNPTIFSPLFWSHKVKW